MTWGFIWRRWLVSLACLLHGLAGLITFGFWQTGLELRADSWFIDWCGKQNRRDA